MLSIDVDRKMDCKVDNVVSCWTFDCDATAAVKSIFQVERTYKYIVTSEKILCCQRIDLKNAA